ncbi:MAG TPA: methyltransferase [Gammaproteobacteria bacterium]
MGRRDPNAPPAPDPAALVADLSRAHIAARCLHVIAECGAADAVGDAGASPAEIAAHTGLDADALDRMLRLLAAHGVFVRTADGRYAHSAASRLLKTDEPGSLRSYARMGGMPAFWDKFTELGRTAREGQGRNDMANLVEYFAAHPDEAAIFNAAMVSKSRTVLPAVTAAYDFGAFATIADIGGGRGHLLKLILERTPRAHGILFERPHVIADTEPAPRLELVGGDFFADSLPAADLYLLMEVLHDWDDADATRILGAVRRAARPGARVLIVEILVPDTPGPHPGKTRDIIMLAVTGGRERTKAQHAALLAAAGFELARVVPTAAEYSLVEAVAV